MAWATTAPVEILAVARVAAIASVIAVFRRAHPEADLLAAEAAV